MTLFGSGLVIHKVATPHLGGVATLCLTSPDPCPDPSYPQFYLDGTKIYKNERHAVLTETPNERLTP